MSEMVERVAQAIYDRCNHWDHDDHLPAYSTLTDGWKAQWQDAARAAIEAMREPTEIMCVAPEETRAIGAKRSWQAMIDAALK